MSEHEHEEIDPDEVAEGAPIEPDPGFGEQDEAAQEEEWSEDAAEGGASEH
jgi:hypothetical protein